MCLSDGRPRCRSGPGPLGIMSRTDVYSWARKVWKQGHVVPDRFAPHAFHPLSSLSKLCLNTVYEDIIVGGNIYVQ